MSTEQGSSAQQPGGLKGLFSGFLGGGLSAPKPIKTQRSGGLQKQDSMPEIVMTPSDIGVHETSHSGLRGPDGKLDWRRVFRAPTRSNQAQPSAGSAPTAAGAGGQTQQ